MSQALEGDALGFTAQWVQREPPSKEPENADSLDGLRILLDPGHYGGAWSEHESRHVQRDGELPIREGNLTYATAELAAEALTQAGATVYLTREAPRQPLLRAISLLQLSWSAKRRSGSETMRNAVTPDC